MSFDDLIGTEDLSPADEARLRRVHQLLVQAGPPPDLSPELTLPPVHSEESDPPEVAYLLRRRRGLTAVIALAAALAVFAAGYGFGHSKGKPSAFTSVRQVAMHGTANPAAHGVIRIAERDDVGNWPMQFEVSGLPQQTSRSAYYVLWLTENGKPTLACGAFRVHGKTTRVRLSVPYTLKGVDGWVVTAQPRDHAPLGPTVLST
jgi:hypothetical protein